MCSGSESNASPPSIGSAQSSSSASVVVARYAAGASGDGSESGTGGQSNGALALVGHTLTEADLYTAVDDILTQIRRTRKEWRLLNEKLNIKQQHQGQRKKEGRAHLIAAFNRQQKR